MIKTYEEFINESEELENFYEDFEKSEIKLKLFTKFKTEIKEVENTGSFSIGEPKKKFKPKSSTFKKNNDKGIF
jgi:hypothetical protein